MVHSKIIFYLLRIGCKRNFQTSRDGVGVSQISRQAQIAVAASIFTTILVLYSYYSDSIRYLK